MAIDPVNILWDACTEEEPSTDSDYEYQSSGFAYLFSLVNSTPYNVSGVAGESPENFWFNLGAGGQTFCIDDEEYDMISTNRIVLPNINTCFETTIWVDMMTQCQDCNDNQTAPKGHWWKTETEFQEDELTDYATVSSSFNINPLQYQMLVDCLWNVEYGCQDDELN